VYVILPSRSRKQLARWLLALEGPGLAIPAPGVREYGNAVTPVLVEKVPGLTVKSAGRQPVSKPPVCGIEAPVGVVVPATQAPLTISSERSGAE
jgi:hypothetical protein